MTTSTIDRRAAGPVADAASSESDATRIVQQGLLIQACLCTISAVEFLKSRNIDAGVIGRVLTGGQIRMGDQPMSTGRIADAACEA